jgi:hypothetical protein
MTIPTPEHGLVLHYSYLWHGEYQAGEDAGRKDRPSVIILRVEAEEKDGTTVVTVLPITHTAPRKTGTAVEIPLAVKKHLGLDDSPSWVVVNEGNEFMWPGYDMKKVPKTKKYTYGFLPPALFNKIRSAFVAFHKTGKTKITPRS